MRYAYATACARSRTPAFPLAHLTLQHAWLPSGATVAWVDLGIMALWGLAAAFVAARRFQWRPAD